MWNTLDQKSATYFVGTVTLVGLVWWQRQRLYNLLPNKSTFGFGDNKT